MRMLPRFCAAAVVAMTLAACGDSPTTPRMEPAPARLNGGWMGGGGHIVDADTTSVTTTSSDQILNTTPCTDERGGWMGGGGHYTGESLCP